MLEIHDIYVIVGQQQCTRDCGSMQMWRDDVICSPRVMHDQKALLFQWSFAKVINESVPPSRPWNKPVNVDRLCSLDVWKEFAWEGHNLKSNLWGPSIMNSRRRDVQVWGQETSVTPRARCTHVCRPLPHLWKLSIVSTLPSRSVHLLTVPLFQSHCPRGSRFISCRSMLPPSMLLNNPCK